MVQQEWEAEALYAEEARDPVSHFDLGLGLAALLQPVPGGMEYPVPMAGP